MGGTLVIEVLGEEEVGGKVLILLAGKVGLHKKMHSHTLVRYFYIYFHMTFNNQINIHQI